MIEPCRTATAATLVPAGELMAVNQLMGILSAVARLVGGPIGGVILGFYGIRAVLIADAATFLLAAVLLGIGLRRRPAAADRQVVAAPGRLLHEWAEGFRIVASSRILRRAMGVVGCTAAAQGAFVVLFVLFVLRDLDGTEADVGVLRGVQAIGAIVGGLLMTPLIKRLAPDRLVAVAALAFGLVSLAIWNAPTLTGAFGVYVALFIVAGVPGIALMTGLITLLQTHSTEADRGRIISVFFAAFGAGQAVGMLVAGLVGTGSGLTVALQMQGALYLLAGVLALRLTAHGAAASTVSAEGAAGSLAKD